MATPLLGWIAPQDRTPLQEQAHISAMAGIRPLAFYGLPVPQLAKGESVRLFDSWHDPLVVADLKGKPFARSHQVTGSCVNSGFFNAVGSTGCAQRVAKAGATHAFLPFTWHNYAIGRHDMGDDGEGDGCMGANIAASGARDGIFEWSDSGEHGMCRYTFDPREGYMVVGGEATEHDWSSIRNPNIKGVLALSKDHRIGSAAECQTANDIKAAILNGYGVAFACTNFIGHASVRGSGKDACVVGEWDTHGPHQQSIHAYWEHPSLGPLYWAQNNWGADTYPDDPAGGPVCGCWVEEANVASAMRRQGEVFLFARIPWIEAVPAILDWFV